MSLNIKTSTGLHEVGRVSRNKVTSALGYTPATEGDLSGHTTNADIHVSATDRVNWNSKADGDSIANITDDLSGDFTITDDNGNIGFKVTSNADNTSTTAVQKLEAKSIEVDGTDITVLIDSRIPEIPKFVESDPTVPAWAKTASKPTYTAKEVGLGNVDDDESGDFIIADTSGNIGFKVEYDSTNKSSTTYVNKLNISGADIETTLDNKADKSHIHTKSEITDFAHTHNITANASDDDIVVLEGTSGTNAVTYTASHKTYGTTEETYKTVTVDKYGHVKGGTNPTTLDGYGITDAVPSSHLTDTNPHGINARTVGLGNVNNTSDDDKPVSKAQQDALDGLKAELSEIIVSESEDLIVVDEAGNIGFKVEDNGDGTSTTYVSDLRVDGVAINETIELIQDELEALDTNKANTNHIHANYASTVTTTGSGNAITAITKIANTITATKGNTFLTSETQLSKGTTSGTGNAVTDISVSGHTVTLTKGNTFLTSHQSVTNNNPTLSWGTTSTVGTIGSTNLTVAMPANPDTHNSHAIISGKKSDGNTDIKGNASDGDITLGDSGVTAGEYGPTSNQTPEYGATFNVPDIKVNSKGIVTSIVNRTIQIPASDDTDTHYTTKLVATTSSGTAHAATANGYTYLRLFDDSIARQSIKIVGSDAASVSSDVNGVITINSTDTKATSEVTNSTYYLTGASTGNSTTTSTLYKREDVFVDDSGTINAKGYNATSDARLKTNFEPFYSNTSILDLPIYRFDFIDGPANQIGCKAQDLQEICPELVVEKEDGYLAIKENKLVYLLLDEIKQLKQNFELIQSENKELRARLLKLEAL